ncbi:hypothetical protein QLX67_12470 [Balneolaceae bacterium ANBcel3]|nr:hypothetical protein [Balneolaceae bacterium ANBcel3]
MAKHPLFHILSKEKRPAASLVTAYVPACAVLLIVGWISHSLEISERVLLLRYISMIIAGIYAFITPHLLFPDSRKTLLQQLNPSQALLFRYQARLLRPITVLSIAVLFIIAYFDLRSPLDALLFKTQMFSNGALFLISITLYALFRYLSIAERSQKWNEGLSGKKGMDALKEIGIVSPLSRGMYPTFMSTVMVTVAGMMAVVLSAAIPVFWATSIPFILFLGYVAIRIRSNLFRYDRLFYQSDAFYSELMGQSLGKTGEARKPAPYKAIYWVPSRWRHAVWTQTVQMDRKRPMGRIIALFCILFWLLLWLGSPMSWVYAWLAIFILSKNLLLWPVSETSLSPPVFQWWIMGTTDWILARFFLQLRWIPPLILTLGAAALFSDSFRWIDAGYVIAFDVCISCITSWGFTRINEISFKKRFI